jgi:hypothetical protein
MPDPIQPRFDDRRLPFVSPRSPFSPLSKFADGGSGAGKPFGLWTTGDVAVPSIVRGGSGGFGGLAGPMGCVRVGVEVLGVEYVEEDGLL